MDSIDIGNAPDLRLGDDISRDVEMQRRPALFHKAPLLVQKNPDTLLYAGHPILKKATSYITSLSFQATDTETSVSNKTAIANIDLTTKLPSGVDHPTSIIVTADCRFSAANTKIGVNTFFYHYGRYAFEYNTLPDNYNMITYNYIRFGVQRYVEERHTVEVLVPIVWHNDIPYLVWDLVYNFSNMAANSAIYRTEIFLFLKGVCK